MKRRTIFKLLRYAGLLVTALAVASMLVPGAWPVMPEGIEGYMIFGGSIMNAIGRWNRVSVVGNLEAAVPGSYTITPNSSTVHRSPVLAIAETLQDAALIL